MTHRSQIRFFEDRRERGVPMALATVYQTEGSTYSKAGATMLVDGDGMFQGMLSGGCLEGDLAVRARVAIESGTAQQAVYDLRGGDDELWGMGVGCEGVMRVLLQPLYADRQYQPWVALHEAALGLEETFAVVVIDGADGAPAGATLLSAACGEPTAFGLSASAKDALAEYVAQRHPDTAAAFGETLVAGVKLGLLTYRVPRQPRLLVFGAGLDAGPVVRFAAELGWHCTLVDHRPAYLEQGGFDSADRMLSVPAAEAFRHVKLDEFDLAIVMSHHLASDREYLSQLAGASVPYVGLLGPPARRNRLMSELGTLAGKLEGRLNAPAGIDIGGRGPAAIALSILAEMQMHLGARSGGL